jgi:hypothetical protein
MNPADARQVQYHLQSAAKLLKANTPEADLQDFESIELAARKHMLETVGPAIGEIFFPQESQKQAGKNGR